jgi:hypothetical protein
LRFHHGAIEHLPRFPRQRKVRAAIYPSHPGFSAVLSRGRPFFIETRSATFALCMESSALARSAGNYGCRPASGRSSLKTRGVGGSGWEARCVAGSGRGGACQRRAWS